MSHRRLTGQKGFTIIELMIATTILSVILLIVTVIMVNIGNLYYKGVNQARIQDDVRNVSDELAQQLQLNNDLVAIGDGKSSPGAYCIGNVRYNYVIGQEITSSPQTHVLWRDSVPAGGCAVLTTAVLNAETAASDPGGSELIAPNSRLINFSITGSSPYTISIGMAYGADDLLCSPSAPATPNTCDVPATMNSTYFLNGDLTCKGETGNQFCATSSLTTSVVRRLL